MPGRPSAGCTPSCFQQLAYSPAGRNDRDQGPVEGRLAPDRSLCAQPKAGDSPFHGQAGSEPGGPGISDRGPRRHGRGPSANAQVTAEPAHARALALVVDRRHRQRATRTAEESCRQSEWRPFVARRGGVQIGREPGSVSVRGRPGCEPSGPRRRRLGGGCGRRAREVRRGSRAGQRARACGEAAALHIGVQGAVVSGWLFLRGVE